MWKSISRENIRLPLLWYNTFGVATNRISFEKPARYCIPKHLNAKGTAAGGSHSFIMFMKKLFAFIALLILMIISEYFLLNELFSHRRVTVLLLSLVGTVIFLFAVVRFFKKYILAAKQS